MRAKVKRLLEQGRRPTILVRDSSRANGEMTSTVGQVIGRQLRFEPITEEEARMELIAHGDQPESVDYHLSIFRAIREGRMGIVTDTIQRVLGRSPFTFEQWVEENASRFSE
jgi:hypothetical protein